MLPHQSIKNMKKKTLIGLAIAIILIAAAVWLNLKPQKTAEKPDQSQAPELDLLLTDADQNLNDAEAAIKNLDDIDETADNEENLAITLDNLIQGKETAPVPSDATDSSPKTGNAITSDLDALLGEIDAAQNAVNNAISDLDSIDENEDKVSI